MHSAVQFVRYYVSFKGKYIIRVFGMTWGRTIQMCLWDQFRPFRTRMMPYFPLSYIYESPMSWLVSWWSQVLNSIAPALVINPIHATGGVITPIIYIYDWLSIHFCPSTSIQIEYVQTNTGSKLIILMHNGCLLIRTKYHCLHTLLSTPSLLPFVVP